MLDKKAQSSIEALLLLAFVFIGVLYVFYFFFQTNSSTLAMQLAKTSVMEKISALDGFFYLEKIDSRETSTATGTALELLVFIKPETHGLTAQSFSADSASIAGRTRYESITISPMCNNAPCQ